jgi:hypothetical protein
MPAPTQLFGIINEFVVLLLGALMTLLALTGRFALPQGAVAWVVVGVVFIYWGLRAWVLRGPGVKSWQANLRGSSLVLVGALMLLMRWLPAHYAGLLLTCAGGLLIVRALAGAALLFHQR